MAPANVSENNSADCTRCRDCFQLHSLENEGTRHPHHGHKKTEDEQNHLIEPSHFTNEKTITSQRK